MWGASGGETLRDCKDGGRGGKKCRTKRHEDEKGGRHANTGKEHMRVMPRLCLLEDEALNGAEDLGHG